MARKSTKSARSTKSSKSTKKATRKAVKGTRAPAARATRRATTRRIVTAGAIASRSRTFRDARGRARISLTQPTAVVSPAEAEARLQAHKAVLSSFGVEDLAQLGNLTLSGNLVPQAGLTSVPAAPTPAPVRVQPHIWATEFATLAAGETVVSTAFRLPRVGVRRGRRQAVGQLERFGGSATLLRAQPHPAPAVPESIRMSGQGPHHSIHSLASLPINTAYWAADWINIASNTNVILKDPIWFLVIIARRLTVGTNVTFTWERPVPPNPPSKPANPPKPPAQPPSMTIAKGPAGFPGIAGQPGGRGLDGIDAPELEIWLLDMEGSPAFDLRGQGWDDHPAELFQGGPGGDGGDGGDGAPGSPDAVDFIGFCSRGPGNGGDGGPGGRAGNGGPGGSGGHGGRLSLFAPQAVLTKYSQGFYVSVDGGAPGPGGIPGVPGTGGNGGPRGDNSHGCKPGGGEVRTSGSPGPQGAAGIQGPPGVRGQTYPDALRMRAVSADEFNRALSNPAITALSAATARQGDVVTAAGLRFTINDVAVLNGMLCETTVFSDTQASFRVPATTGGPGFVQMRQIDGTLSNKASLHILPSLASAVPSGRVSPGSTVRLNGSGFAPGLRVRVNNQDMPNVRYLNPNTADFTLVRPTGVAPNAAGENVAVNVVLPNGLASNTIPLVLQTFRLVVLGDSVAWGQGLAVVNKFHTLTENTIRTRRGDIGVYKDVFAHSGAIIGLTPPDSTALPPVNGEIPTNYPTVSQQLALFTDPPDSVQLLLVDGGINDVNVRTILNPLTSTATINTLTDQACHVDMRTLLLRIAGTLPSSRIIVTGYFPIISANSDTLLLEALLIAAGLSVASIPGAIVGGVIGPATKRKIVANCTAFNNRSRTRLRMAVDEANAIIGGRPRIFLAIPRFTAMNAALAPNKFLFGIHADLSPEDEASVAGPRAVSCAAESGRTSLEICKRASIGHPNNAGANAYFNAIRPFL